MNDMKQIICVLFLLTGTVAKSQEPWKASQLLAPAVLAEKIQQKAAPVIISVGPGAVIPNSVDIGMTGNAANYEKLKSYLKGTDKNKEIVVYCGCCPFEHCPNIRPAFTLLNSLGFVNAKLLNLSTNIKTDWINKGYPVNK